MKFATDRSSFIVRILLLMICCALFIPHGGAYAQKKNDIADTVRVASMTLAITGITNPVSHIQNLSSAETPALRSSTPRSGASLAGKRSNIASSIKRNQLLSFWIDADDATAALPTPPILPELSPCAKAPYSFRLSLPKSHGHIHWFALAPPTSLCA